jgi:GT2 family glycosyltransferase
MPQPILHSWANFDIGVLFYNRARQTLDCVLSFLDEDTQPNIIILDQGSAAEQRQLLNEALGHRPNVRFVDLVENIGVAAGRNRLCRECTAEWILFIDNDVILNTQGGVALLNSALERADDVEGILPRLLNVHENRFVDGARLTNATGHLIREPIGPDDTTTNLFPGGAVVLRRSFLLDNPFDENCFVGFEDWELAARAFTIGMPLRIGILHDVTLVHKHMPVVSEPDIASTKIRYSRALIAKSVDVLKVKYGGKILTGYWESWIEKQQQELIVAHRIAPRIPRDKVKITFVADVPNSALDNIVRNLNPHIGNGHPLTIVYADNVDIGQSLQLIIDSCSDVIHFMWRGHFRKLVGKIRIQKCAALMGLTETEVLDRLCQCHITFSVCDHLFLDGKDIDFFRPLYWLSDGYSVESPLLFDIYRLISDYPKPAAMIPSGVGAFSSATGQLCLEPELRKPLTEENPEQEAKQDWATHASLWRAFFAGVIRHAHPDASDWRRFMIEKYFLVADN